MSRKDSGFLWGRGNIDYGNLSHYDSALKARNVRREEYWYHSVFHGPTYAEDIVREVYQQRLRQGEKRYSRFNDIISTEDTEVVNSVSYQEISNNETSTQISCDTSIYNRRRTSDKRLELVMILASTIDGMNEDELLVLAFYMCLENLDTLLEHEDDALIERFRPYLVRIWNLPGLTWQCLYTLSSRSKIDAARNSLRNIFTEASREV